VLLENGVEPEPLHELHGDVADTRVLADLVQRHDVGVTEPCGRTGLALEAGGGARARGILPTDDLQGHAPAERLLHREEHLAHAAVTEGPDDPERAQARGRGSRIGDQRLARLLVHPAQGRGEGGVLHPPTL
jgi:hypothetical protein